MKLLLSKRNKYKASLSANFTDELKADNLNFQKNIQHCLKISLNSDSENCENPAYLAKHVTNEV